MYNLNDFKAEQLKSIFNQEDFNQWVKLEEKGKRLGEIIRTASGRYAADATAGMQKIASNKRRLLRKYGLIPKKTR